MTDLTKTKDIPGIPEEAGVKCTQEIPEDPWANVYPKDVYENLQYRHTILQKCEEDEQFRLHIQNACKRSLLFFVNTFLWLFEPRSAKKLPFVTWEEQDNLLRCAQAVWGKEPLHVPKSRDIGASWSMLACGLWHWQFYPDQGIGLGSRDMESVDGGTHDALFWKLDFLLKYQPSWLKPKVRRKFERKENKLLHPYNGSEFVGRATKTGDFFRSGRKIAIIWDEVAACDPNDQKLAVGAIQNVTDCPIYISTYKGDADEFSRLRHILKNKAGVHWSANPRYNKGMYLRNKDGSFEYKDPDYNYPDDYEFVPDGILRSPRYDHFEFERGMTRVQMAQEFDMNPVGSGAVFLDDAVRREQLQECVRDPKWVGDLKYEVLNFRRPQVLNTEFKRSSAGPVKLWIDPPGGKLHNDDYIISCDISWGTGATPSCASIISKTLRCKVGEVATPHLEPTDFADMVVGLCQIFNQAYLIWESNGPGSAFGERIKELRYRRVYRRRDEDKEFPEDNPTDKPGFKTTGSTKYKVFSKLVSWMKSGKYEERSEDALQELSEYTYDGNTVTHPRSKTKDDDSSARENHGDRAIATALGVWALSLFPTPRARSTKAVVPGTVSEVEHLIQRAQELQHESLEHCTDDEFLSAARRLGILNGG